MSNSTSELDNLSVCANCGKGEEDSIDLKTCTACKLVKYCSRECQIAHRPQHKKACKKRAAELHDIELFKQPPPNEDCPICFLLLPLLESGRRYKPCCGKVICGGCAFAPLYDNQGNIIAEEKCPFCRTLAPTLEESKEMEKKRVELNDPIAIYNLGVSYTDGINGYPQDYKKALELYHRAGDLGNAEAYRNLGLAYLNGRGVEVNEKKKANHYWKLAAMGGDARARFNLGIDEIKAGNFDRALKHYLIAAKGGESKAVENIKQLYTLGHATKSEYTEALRAYQTYLGEVKSVQRDKAAAYHERYRYY